MSTFPESSPFYDVEKPIEVTPSYARLAMKEEEEIRKEAARKQAADQAFRDLDNLIEDLSFEGRRTVTHGEWVELQSQLEEVRHAFARAIER